MSIAAQQNDEENNFKNGILQPIFCRIESSADVTDLRIRNMYEYQVIVSLGNCLRTYIKILLASLSPE